MNMRREKRKRFEGGSDEVEEVTLRLNAGSQAAKVLKRETAQERAVRKGFEAALATEERRLKRERAKEAKDAARKIKQDALDSDKNLSAVLSDLLEATELAAVDRNSKDLKREALSSSIRSTQAKIDALNSELGRLVDSLASLIAKRGLMDEEGAKKLSVEELQVKARQLWTEHESVWDKTTAGFRKKHRDRKVRALARRLGISAL